MILVTGGCGFIGSNFILNWLSHTSEPVINLDALTYAGNLENLVSIKDNPAYTFIEGNILNKALVQEICSTYRPRALIHFAAESHVDRSIHGPEIFMRTNIEGTFNLLETSLAYWKTLKDNERKQFRFLHVSTDEVFGSLEANDPAFTEETAYKPNSPYSASKAASDHLVRAWHETYGLPVLTTNCSNNYGPFQFPEKLIPLMIHNALSGKALPIYGDGQNIRDWLYVVDHCDAIMTVLESGKTGKTYNIGGCNEMTNLELVKHICETLDTLKPDPAGSYARLITFVQDRPGHDRRYAINAHKISTELGWQPKESVYSGLQKTVSWYLSHADWLTQLVTRSQNNLQEA